MMHFKNRPFGELFAEPTRNGLTRPKAVRGSGTKMVNMGELFANARIRDIPMDRVPLSPVEAERSLLKAGDLLFARQSLVLEGAGKCSIFLGDEEQVTFESHVTRVRLNEAEADPRFYFYWLQSFSGRNAIRSIVEQGAGAAGIRGSDLQNLSVIWCPPNTQREIANILSSLDDKIELNRRMNETLEAMARAIFQSWFVDFDPVRAKVNGDSTESICQRLGLTPALLELFPDALIETEMGATPEGWPIEVLGELCDRVAMGPFGSDIKTDNFVPDGVPIIRGGNLKDGFGGGNFVFLTEEKADELRNANAFPGDIVLTHRGTLGQVGLIPSDSDYPRYVISQSQMLLSVTKSKTTARYVYEYLRSPQGLHALLSNTSQVGVPAISRPTTSLKAIRVLNPAMPILQAYDQLTGSLFAAISANGKATDSVSKIRDALLPKLLSGALALRTLEGSS
jgi:type I restriction enzyme, S subunit